MVEPVYSGHLWTRNFLAGHFVLDSFRTCKSIVADVKIEVLRCGFVG